MIRYIKVMRPPLVILSMVAPLSLMWYYHHSFNIFIILAILFGNISLNIFNEILDKETDKILKPWKPIPSGEVDLKKVKLFFVITLLLSIICLLFIKPILSLIGFIGIVCGYLYNKIRYIWYGENLFLGLSYGLASYLCSYPHGLVFSVAFALLTISFNIAVQIQDMEGDLKAGQNTLPLNIGIEKSMGISVLCGIISSTLFFLYINKIYSLFFMICEIFIFIALIINTDKGYTYLVRYATRVCMFFGFLSMFFL